jgi:ribosome-associated protein
VIEGTLLNAQDTCLKAVELALEKKAYDLQLLKVRELSSLTDYLLIASGRSDRQVSAIAESIRLGLKEQGVVPLATEGVDEGRWALLDYGDFMVHVFQPAVRTFYDLEGLWTEAPHVALADTGQA